MAHPKQLMLGRDTHAYLWGPCFPLPTESCMFCFIWRVSRKLWNLSPDFSLVPEGQIHYKQNAQATYGRISFFSKAWILASRTELASLLGVAQTTFKKRSTTGQISIRCHTPWVDRRNCKSCLHWFYESSRKWTEISTPCK